MANLNIDIASIARREAVKELDNIINFIKDATFNNTNSCDIHDIKEEISNLSQSIEILNDRISHWADKIDKLENQISPMVDLI